MDMTNLTIIMYHYVRDLKNSKYPDIKGLDFALFQEQIDYIATNYTPVRVEDVIEACQNKTSLPEGAALLTFDDGYVDHFTYVFPTLQKKGIQGAFYAPVQAITKNKVLDVNKVHFILASQPDTAKLIKVLFGLLDEYRDEYSLLANDVYFDKLAKPFRYDTAEVIFIKRLLQVELPYEARKTITNKLFTICLDTSESDFSKELYMDSHQISEMLDAGMHVGAHGYRHEWLGCMDEAGQEEEVRLSVEFLDQLGIPVSLRTICYPYGSFNDSLLAILKSYNFQLGMTSKIGVADLASDTNLTLPRLDTNDITANMKAA